MAPVPATEDYYLILEVEQNAAQQLIVSSYRRLARKLHPDRNKSPDATAAFQLLARAYETLNDESKRRDYDLTYISSTRRSFFTSNAQTPKPPPASTPQSEALSDAAKISSIQNLKQERRTRWQNTKDTFDASIFKLQREIRQVEQEIRNLDSITAAEAAAEAQKNSWGTWLLSPLYKKAEESEDVKVRKDRERQEGRIEKDMKERRLDLRKVELKTMEDRSRKAEDEFNSANRDNDEKIRLIRNRIWVREERERQAREEKKAAERQARQARETAERERAQNLWRHQRQEELEKRRREAAETSRKQRAEWQAGDERRRQEDANLRQRNNEARFRASRNQNPYSSSTGTSTYQAGTSTCLHHGWWSKEIGFAACPNCNDTWKYLLECPSCKIKACPKCQADIRPKRRRNMPNTQPNRKYSFEESWPDYD